MLGDLKIKTKIAQSAIVICSMLVQSYASTAADCSNCTKDRFVCLGQITPLINNTVKDVATLDQMQGVCTRAWEACTRGCTVGGQQPVNRNTSGGSLAPGTTDRTDTTEGKRDQLTPKKPTPGSIHMGNDPVSGGERSNTTKEADGNSGKRPNYGLTDNVRKDLERVKNSVSERTAYLRRLAGREREQAIEYLSDPTTGLQVTIQIAESADCRGMRARLSPHALNEAWIIDQMARSHCKPDGTPMTLREATKYEMYKGL